MHQLDPILKSLDADLEVSSTPEDATGLKKQIKEREDTLMPMYLQVSHITTVQCTRLFTLHQRSHPQRKLVMWPL
jgi:hypothetical protein